ncbi:MAG: hypothetical protein ACREVE_09515 [Gammaproteobacteria bacterium]
MREEPEAVYAGLAGRSLDAPFGLGEGVTLSPTFTHIMAPLMAAFAPAEKGKPHPAPWKAVSGGFGFDIVCELRVPTTTARRHNDDPYDTLRCITALIRLRSGPGITLPAITTLPFSEVKTSGNDVHIWPYEIEPRLLRLQSNYPQSITELELAWVKAHWAAACSLAKRHDELNLAVQAYDQCPFHRSPSIALLTLWAALEALFSGGREELRFRISAGVAAFLEPPGIGRLSLQKHIAKLYDSRSAAAHGRVEKAQEPLLDTYSLARRALIKMIEDNLVPTKAELEVKLFGADVTP